MKSVVFRLPLFHWTVLVNTWGEPSSPSYTVLETLRHPDRLFLWCFQVITVTRSQIASKMQRTQEAASLPPQTSFRALTTSSWD